jgi:opacity protein-like surface antigen
MKKMKTHFLYFLSFIFCVTSVFAQYDEEETGIDRTWKQKGFEFYIGSNAYFASKKTASYYNGSPENEINLNLIFNNEYRYLQLWELMNVAYPYQEKFVVEEYNMNSSYSVAMDLAFGAKYRFHKNWYLDLSYSFRRLTADNTFVFFFPDVQVGNQENQRRSQPQHLLGKEDRHYIDLSVGYIAQKHHIAKPFLAVGVMFTHVKINRFLAIIEGTQFDLMNYARYPNSTPGIQDMPDNRVWSGPGYGFSLTAGLKIAFSRVVSIDPVFQLSVASFGNSAYIRGFNTAPCFNFFAGVRLVMCDALIFRNK